MASHSTQLFLHQNYQHKPLVTSSNFYKNNNHAVSKTFAGVLLFGAKDKTVYKSDRDVQSKCNAISKPCINDFTDVFQSGVSVIKWQQQQGIDVDDDVLEGEEAIILKRKRLSKANEIEQRVESIKSMLGRMDDGEISVSAYDTAWVALVENVQGTGCPQFPSALQWIARNQLPDGSWGDRQIFSAHDRLINTLACVVALKFWNVHPEKCTKGMTFFNENLSKLERENPEHMPIGFEVAFPSLLDIARRLNLQVNDDSPVLQDIYSRRDIKLTKIPREIMHTKATTLLHSLEGMTGLEWEKILKLQSRDGSFLFSPSSTAFALMETKDRNCLNYLTKAVHRFNGGVPNVYPVDLFEHLWVVDRLHRLGLSRYFDQEIKECINYVHRYWTEKGIGWARNSDVRDIDDTAMAFRLLRLHGHKVSADVFENFKKGDEFFCFLGQTTQAVTGMYNLFRASQLLFPGEKILEKAKDFSSRFLREKQANNELIDKWIITKDLPGEVGYALEGPWYASLPRVETRSYIEQYGGQNDVWIGKTLYRMPCVNNNEYLELAKKDFNICQELHSIEWHNMQQWYRDCRLGEYGLSRKSLLFAYYLAAATIFEPERAEERLAWAKTTALMETIRSHFSAGDEFSKSELRKSFAHAFKRSTYMQDYLNFRRANMTKLGHGLLGSLIATLSQASVNTILVHGRDISHHLRQAWEKWLLRWQEEGDVDHHEDAELLVQTIILFSGRTPLKGLVPNPHYNTLFNVTNSVCNKIRRYQKQRHKVHLNGRSNKSTATMTMEIESEMQELVKLVLEKSDVADAKIKQTFLTVAKTFYYAAHYDSKTIRFHIHKVLFETVD